MALRKEQKRDIVSNISEYASSALSIVAADYRGITSTDMTQLRADARAKGVRLKIVRNTLARRALQGTAFECMKETLVGPVLLAFADAEPGANARLLRDFAKTNDKLVVKSLALDGKLLGKEHLDAVADLPTKEEAIAKLMSVMQAPVAKLVRTIAAPTSKLVRTIDAVRAAKAG